jgi:nicotinamidase-related amidase
VSDGSAFRRQLGAQISDAITQEAGDILVEGKRGLDGFATTGLDLVLRNNGIQNLVVTGFLTNCCVEGTVRSGYEKGYNVVTLTDCTAPSPMNNNMPPKTSRCRCSRQRCSTANFCAG